MVRPLVAYLLPWLLLGAGAVTAQSFAPVTPYSVGSRGSNPRGLACADFNQDGTVDVATANYVDTAVGVLLNLGQGTFAAPVAYGLAATHPPYDVATGDFNQDGYPALVTANYQGRSVSVLLNRGDGTFAPEVVYGLPGTSYPQRVVVADLNQDGYPDLVSANLGAPTVSVLLNQRDGTLALAGSYPVASNCESISLATGDFNQDGALGIAVASYNNNSTTVGVLLHQRDGTFAPLVPLPVRAASQPTGIAVGDVNGDNLPDVLTANLGDNTVGVLLNQGGGSFAPARSYATGTGSKPFAVALGELNRDGTVDLVASYIGQDRVGVLLGQADGTFAAATTYATGAASAPSQLTVQDVNRDGQLDVLTCNSSSGTLGVLLTQTALATPAGAATAQLGLFPNPSAASTPARLLLTGLPSTVHRVEAYLTDGVGRVVGTATWAVQQGQVQGVVPTRGVAPGLYQLRLSDPDGGRDALRLPSQQLEVR